MRKIENWAQQLYAKYQTVRADEEGATAVEYAVMLAVVLAVVVPPSQRSACKLPASGRRC